MSAWDGSTKPIIKSDLLQPGNDYNLAGRKRVFVDPGDLYELLSKGEGWVFLKTAKAAGDFATALLIEHAQEAPK